MYRDVYSLLFATSRQWKPKGQMIGDLYLGSDISIHLYPYTCIQKSIH